MQGRYPDAEKLFERALAINPHYQEALQGLIGLYLREKQPAKALARVDEHIAKDPQTSSYYLLRGLLLLNAKNMAKAQEALEKSVALDKTNQTASLVFGQTVVGRWHTD